MKMSEEYLRYVFGIDAALIETLVSAAPHIEKEQLTIGFHQCRYAQSIREILRTGCP
jgi:hypothetical protein